MVLNPTHDLDLALDRHPNQVKNYNNNYFYSNTNPGLYH